MQRSLAISYKGPTLLENALLNKGSAFSLEERRALGLIGLLPNRVETIEEQLERCYKQFTSFAKPMSKHIYLRNLQDTNETLFYQLVRNHLEEMMLIIYTPTVGEACRQFSSIYRRARGLFVSWSNFDHVDEVVNTVTKPNVKVIVITDGERILGLGDQGIGGMGIPIGKLSLYTACGGISPAYTLPVLVDIGTNNHDLLHDPVYMGLRQPRLSKNDDYLRLMDKLLAVLHQRWPKALIQFEDFALAHANELLDRYKNRYCCFNDDIQGTAAVTLATLIRAASQSGTSLDQQRCMFVGAGSAGCGIAEQLIEYLMCHFSFTRTQALERVLITNRRGVLIDSDTSLLPFQHALAQPAKQYAHLREKPLATLVKQLQPTALIGATGKAGTFTHEVITTMTEYCHRPIIFPLSNPTSKAEASAEDLINWTKGNGIVASGSPFMPVAYQGRHYSIAQCNNCYIFPGVGLGVTTCHATTIDTSMMMAATQAIVDYPCQGLLPLMGEIMQVSRQVACAVIQQALEKGYCPADVANALTTAKHIQQAVDDNFWNATYRDYRATANAVS